MDKETFLKLENISKEFFPMNGSWGSGCFKNKEQYLCCNLRNNDFLAKRMIIICKSHNIELDFESAKEFVSNSSVFQEQRHLYEQRIVKWQINWIASGGEGWVINENYGGDACLFMSNCDLAFRQGVVDTLTSINIADEAIEEGLEKNSDLWRDKYMNMAFSNQYEERFSAYFRKGVLEKADEEFKESWLKMRTYEYYQSHKESVIKYGVVTQEMIMCDEEVLSLKAYLNEQHKKRIAYLNSFKTKNKELKISEVEEKSPQDCGQSCVKVFSKKLKDIFHLKKKI